MCGGKSSRMGKDKGLLIKVNQTWAQLAFEKLFTITSSVKISVNNPQKELYQKLFPNESLFIDSIDISGPLAGILSAHIQYPNLDFLILACDMTDIKIAILQQLVKEYKTKKEVYDFFVFKNEGVFEPLLGIYTRKGLEKIIKIYEADQLKKYSLKYVLEAGNTCAIELTENQKKEFKNYNEATDL